MISKWPASPVASADESSHVPLSVSAPDDDVAQSLGSVMAARMVPVRDAAQLAGGEPVRMRRIGAVPIVVSMASSRALRTAMDS